MYGEEPAAYLSNLTGIQQHTVRRVLASAFEKETLVRRVFVNQFDLGLQQYAVFISAKINSTAARNRIRQALLAAPWIELLIEVTGDFDFGLVVTARSVLDLEALLDSISKKTTIQFSRLQIQARTGWYYFGAKHLLPSNPLQPISIFPTGRPLHLTYEEALVLEAFATERTGNVTKMARSVGMRSTTFDYQLEKLKSNGVILGVRYQFTPHAIGFSPHRALIVLGSYSLEIRQQLRAWAEKSPYVISLMFGVGPWHCELRIEAPDAVVVNEVIDDLRYSFFSVVERVSLLPVLKVLKMKLHPDLSLFTGGAHNNLSNTKSR
jgi:DNA-binding Lrp family transcriptional regulator